MWDLPFVYVCKVCKHFRSAGYYLINFQFETYLKGQYFRQKRIEISESFSNFEPNKLDMEYIGFIFFYNKSI